MKNEHGFSLVELLIVVAIIAIIAAIAVPSLLTSRQAANEAGAIQGCRTIGSAEIAFAATNNQQFTDLNTLATGNFLDARFSLDTNVINGYTYGTGDVPQIDGGAVPNGFEWVATPTTGMGRYAYGVAPDMVVRWVAAGSPDGLPGGVVDGDPIGKRTS